MARNAGIEPAPLVSFILFGINKYRTYLPDFYIVDHRVFLDVKNPIKMIEDRDKLSQLVAVMPLFIGNIQQVQDYMVGLTGLEPVS